MNTTIFRTKVGENEKISDVSGLVKKTDYDVKTKDIEGKYFAAVGSNKFTSNILNGK